MGVLWFGVSGSEDNLDNVTAMLLRDGLVKLFERERGDELLQRELSATMHLQELRDEGVRVAITFDNADDPKSQALTVEQRKRQGCLRVAGHAQQYDRPPLCHREHHLAEDVG